MSGVGDLAARLVTPAPPRHVIGRAVADPVTGAVTVDIGGTQVVAGVPGSVRGVAEGQMLRVSVEGRAATVDAILTGTTTPTVAAPPSASAVAPLTMSDALGFTAAGFDNTGFTSQDFQAALYAEYLKGVLNDAIDVINNHQATIASLKATVNSLRTTVAELRTALIEQGHVV